MSQSAVRDGRGVWKRLIISACPSRTTSMRASSSYIGSVYISTELHKTFNHWNITIHSCFVKRHLPITSQPKRPQPNQSAWTHTIITMTWVKVTKMSIGCQWSQARLQCYVYTTAANLLCVCMCERNASRTPPITEKHMAVSRMEPHADHCERATKTSHNQWTDRTQTNKHTLINQTERKQTYRSSSRGRRMAE